MAVMGHRTASMFFRYSITSEADKVQAFERLVLAQANAPKVVSMPRG